MNTNDRSGHSFFSAFKKAFFSRNKYFFKGLFIFFIGVGGILGLAFVGLMLRLSQGPVSLTFIQPSLIHSLEAHLGYGLRVGLDSLKLTRGSHGLSLLLDSVSLTSQDGQEILKAPRAEIALSLPSLLLGHINPLHLQIEELDLRLSLTPEGGLNIAAGSPPIPLSNFLNKRSDLSLSSPLKPKELEDPSSEKEKGQSFFHPLTLLLQQIQTQDLLFPDLTSLTLQKGHLRLEDMGQNRQWVFADVQLAFKKEAHVARLDIRAQGHAGPWTIGLTTFSTSDKKQILDVDVSDLSLEEILLASPLEKGEKAGFDLTAPLSIKTRLVLTSQGLFEDISGRFMSGAGFFRLHDPSHERVLIDEITGNFHWDKTQAQLIFDSGHFYSGGTHLTLSALLTPPSPLQEAWSFEAQTGPESVLESYPPSPLSSSPAQTPSASSAPSPDSFLPLQKAALTARFLPHEKRFFLDQFLIKGENFSFTASASGGWQEANQELGHEAGFGLSLTLSASSMPLRYVLRFWPSFLAVKTRAWLLDHITEGMLKQGTIHINFSPQDLEAVRQEHQPSDSSTQIDFEIENTTLFFLPEVPPLSNLTGQGHITGRRVEMNATQGTLLPSVDRAPLELTQLSFNIPELGLKPLPSQVKAHVTGPVEAFAEILTRGKIKSYVNLPLDPSRLHGQGKGDLLLDFKIGKDVTPQDVLAQANLTATNFSIDHFYGKEKFDQGTLALDFNRGALKTSLQGFLLGVPALLNVQREKDHPVQATLSFTLDEQTRLKQNLTLNGWVTGPLTVKVTGFLGENEKFTPNVEVDLTQASLNSSFPGLIKPVGQPGKINFTALLEGSSFLLEPFLFESGGLFARGHIKLDPNNQLDSFLFQTARFSPGDEMKVEGAAEKEGFKLIVRAETLDIRPFLSFLSLEKKTTPGNQNFYTDIKARLVNGGRRSSTGGSSAVLEMTSTYQKNLMTHLYLQARLGPHSLSAETIPASPSRQTSFVFRSDNIGSILSFLGFYTRMEGGQFEMSLIPQSPQISTGSFNIRDFILRDEPALQRLSTQVQPSLGTEALQTVTSFKRVQGQFQRNDGRLLLQETSLVGPQVGVTLNGTIDFRRSILDITGTFVPAFGLNNFFSRIPVFGLVLGGGKNEGLLGVTYHATGSLNSPSLTINPLSALTPGFLRKFLGFMDPNQNNDFSMPPSGSVPVAPPKP